LKRLAVLLLASNAFNFGSAANEQNQRLVALSEEDRNLALTSHVQRAGKDCDAVVRSMQITDVFEKAAVWSVSCKNEKEYAVSVFADSGLQPFVISCNDLKDYGRLMGIMERAVNSPQNSPVAECWKKKF